LFCSDEGGYRPPQRKLGEKFNILNTLLAKLYSYHFVSSGFFLTKIFHPNVASNGEICVNTLKKDWKPELGVKHILLVSWMIQGLIVSRGSSCM